MPIKVPTGLPAAETLLAEGVPLIDDRSATRQDIRPLRIAILNLMPLKEQTEVQLARLLGSSPIQIELTLLTTGTYKAKNTGQGHLQSFYSTFDQVKDRKFDGLLITGAPIETLPFEDVIYWPEMKAILDWSNTNVTSLFSICWGAQAALFHFHGVDKHQLAEKRFGIYRHVNTEPTSPIMLGINDSFPVPVSRHTEVREEDIPADIGLRTLAKNVTAGLCLIDEVAKRRFYMFNHLEYDANTLAGEYQRDLNSGQRISFPVDYFPNDDPGFEPINAWRSHAHLMYSNWVNYVYQSSPYNIDEIGTV